MEREDLARPADPSPETTKKEKEIAVVSAALDHVDAELQRAESLLSRAMELLGDRPS